MKTATDVPMKSYGQKGNGGNLVGIEPYLTPQDYTSPGKLEKKLAGYLSAAQEKGWINERTVVVWPEYIGTWLLVSGEKTVPTLQEVVAKLIESHLEAFLTAYAASTEQNKIYAALFRMKAQVMADGYHSIFSGLARKFKVTTIAGSTVLPSPQLIDGKIVLDGNGPLYNVSLVFDSRGRPYPNIVYKAYPTSSEQAFTASAPVGSLPAFDTPIGRLGILICADSWYPQAYARMKELDVKTIAVPSFGHGGLKAWTQKWPGYDGWPTPPDVDRHDINKISNSDAWRKYSLIGRIHESDAVQGINVFLHGGLWPDFDAGGGVAAIVQKNGVWHREIKTPQATINNVWL